MTPTLNGRIQSRIFFVLVVGGLWTLLFTPVLGAIFGFPDDGGLALYRQTFLGLFLVLVLGIGWEIVYHLLQQIRWEKDWPTLLGLLTGFNESILVWIVYRIVAGDEAVSALAFGVFFWTTWLLIWTSVNTWIRIVFPRWRFLGGRIF